MLIFPMEVNADKERGVMSDNYFSPGWPGIPGRWTGADKIGVGTALGGSPVWFTISRGILNEVYGPRIDEAVIRDLGFIITADDGFFSEEKRHTRQTSSMVYYGVPAYRTESACISGRYKLEKEFITDPLRTVVLIKGVFTPLLPGNYKIYLICGSHIENHAAGNTAWVGNYNGKDGLFASRIKTSFCITAENGFNASSVGFVGASDGWRELKSRGKLESSFKRAENGNVALCGEINLNNGIFVIALGIGRNPSEAAHLSIASINRGFENIVEDYISSWKNWLNPVANGIDSKYALFSLSAVVIKTHKTKFVPGAILASLAVPWGFIRGDGDLGGYHLVWPRDMVESAGGLLAAGIKTEVLDSLVYLETTQGADGHWPQNMWVDGFPYWNGIQMDETALPVLLLDLAWREKAVSSEEINRFYPMVKKALSYIVKNGPVTSQDRWEEDGGYTPFTIAAEISSLVVGAEFARLAGEFGVSDYLLETADAWYSCIDKWLYSAGGELAERVNVNGYYVRIRPPDFEKGDDFITIKNKASSGSRTSASSVISADALALVRFGLRRPDDKRILDTLKVIDDNLMMETPYGPCWHRYNGDGYGEHEDGSPFNGTGIGRLWPLLTGERAHYNVAMNNLKEADRLVKTMEGFAGHCGLLPEQVWDGKDIPERGLFFGRPTGSAMPLVWAHAEYLKLVRSITDGSVFDMPPQTYERYVANSVSSNIAHWKFNHKLHTLQPGKILRLEILSPAMIRWSMDDWGTWKDVPAKDSGLGVYYIDLPSSNLPEETKILFTFYWTGSNKWEEKNFTVVIKNKQDI